MIEKRGTSTRRVAFGSLTGLLSGFAVTLVISLVVLGAGGRSDGLRLSLPGGRATAPTPPAGIHGQDVGGSSPVRYQGADDTVTLPTPMTAVTTRPTSPRGSSGGASTRSSSSGSASSASGASTTRSTATAPAHSPVNTATRTTAPASPAPVDTAPDPSPTDTTPDDPPSPTADPDVTPSSTST